MNAKLPLNNSGFLGTEFPLISKGPQISAALIQEAHPLRKKCPYSENFRTQSNIHDGTF